ncbi:hypothetical protein NC653_039778 [Populus alba x Populus x berolinensis]|uniref:Uncharacterized protein n=1 Tax=Populus alba x Populus x berolinensis TaxID=444605 RepID=A0AAD6LC16_9ROSI|nr:hypothetical protein NC653_039778 [Populus alba x Populus x berolinensis]
MIENDKKATQVGPISALVAPGKEEKVPCFYFDVLDWRETAMENVFFSSVLQKKKKKKKFHTYYR